MLFLDPYALEKLAQRRLAEWERERRRLDRPVADPPRRDARPEATPGAPSLEPLDA